MMDVTLFGGNYKSLDIDEALEYIKYLSKCCKLFNGEFVILWHNSSLIQRWERNVYREILEIIS